MRQVGHLPELHEDARSEKYEIQEAGYEKIIRTNTSKQLTRSDCFFR